MSSEQLTADVLGALQRSFYADDLKGFFQQRPLLLKAITYPAWYLDEKGVKLPRTRLKEILFLVIREIQQMGNTGQIQFFGRYFLTVVQRHMAHQGDRYYQEGKSARNALDGALRLIAGKKAKRPALPEAGDTVNEEMAAAHRLILIGKPRAKARKPAAPPDPQISLF